VKNRIVILGAGESGAGAALLAQKQGFAVFLSDKGKIKEKYKQVLLQADIDFEEERHTNGLILSADEIIKSPGIPESVPIVRQAVQKGIPVISEIEFASRYSRARKICITGSNGKTTTTMLTWNILKNAGLDVGLAGNVGRSFAGLIAERDYDWVVLEISSFQLDGMFDFKADIAILLNITPDHLDRYAQRFERYAESKFRILQNMTEKDAFIYCMDDPVIVDMMNNTIIRAKKYPFSINYDPEVDGAFLQGNRADYLKSRMCVNINSESMIVTLQEMTLRGRHNTYNSMAAAIASRLLDIKKETIKQSMMDFHGVEHRLEHVATIRGVDYVNDSKATNINSTWYALENATRPVIWIAGGQDKGNDYQKLMSLVKEKVKAIVCLGVDNSKLHAEFGEAVGIILDTSSATEAVKLAYKLGAKGDCVLLSPACASFDLFDSFEDRGTQFKQAVLNL